MQNKLIDALSFSVVQYLPPCLRVPRTHERRHRVMRLAALSKPEQDAIFIRLNPDDKFWVVVRPCYEPTDNSSLFDVPAITILAHRLAQPVPYDTFWQRLSSVNWELANSSKQATDRLCHELFKMILGFIDSPVICQDLEKVLDTQQFFGVVDSFSSHYLISKVSTDVEASEAIMLARKLDGPAGRSINFLKIAFYEKGELYLVFPAPLIDSMGKRLQPVAYMAVIQELDPFGESGLQIASMGVELEFRRAGIGRQLIETAKRVSRPTPVWAIVPQSNSDCLAFLKAVGSTSKLLKKRPKFMAHTKGDLYLFSIPSRQGVEKKEKKYFLPTT